MVSPEASVHTIIPEANGSITDVRPPAARAATASRDPLEAMLANEAAGRPSDNAIEALLKQLMAEKDSFDPDIRLQTITEMVLTRRRQVQINQRREDAIKADCSRFSVKYIAPSKTLDNDTRLKKIEDALQKKESKAAMLALANV